MGCPYRAELRAQDVHTLRIPCGYPRSDALQTVAVVVEIFQTLAVLQEGGEDVLPFCRCVIRERLALGNEERHLQFVEFSLADSAGLQFFDDLSSAWIALSRFSFFSAISSQKLYLA